MASKDIAIKVNCSLTVDKNTANACLRLVQIYLNANSNIKLIQRQAETGETELEYEPFE